MSSGDAVEIMRELIWRGRIAVHLLRSRFNPSLEPFTAPRTRYRKRRKAQRRGAYHPKLASEEAGGAGAGRERATFMDVYEHRIEQRAAVRWENERSKRRGDVTHKTKGQFLNLRKLLKREGAAPYAALLKESGFHQRGAFAELSDEDLRELGVPPKYRRRIVAAAAKVKLKVDAADEANRTLVSVLREERAARAAAGAAADAAREAADLGHDPRAWAPKEVPRVDGVEHLCDKTHPPEAHRAWTNVSMRKVRAAVRGFARVRKVTAVVPTSAEQLDSAVKVLAAVPGIRAPTPSPSTGKQFFAASDASGSDTGSDSEWGSDDEGSDGEVEGEGEGKGEGEGEGEGGGEGEAEAGPEGAEQQPVEGAPTPTDQPEDQPEDRPEETPQRPKKVHKALLRVHTAVGSPVSAHSSPLPDSPATPETTTTTTVQHQVDWDRAPELIQHQLRAGKSELVLAVTGKRHQRVRDLVAEADVAHVLVGVGIAAQRGDEDTLALLLRHSGAAQASAVRRALLLCVKRRHLHLLRALVAGELSVRVPAAAADEALRLAANRGLRLEADAVLPAATPPGVAAALRVACHHGHDDVIELCTPRVAEEERRRMRKLLARRGRKDLVKLIDVAMEDERERLEAEADLEQARAAAAAERRALREHRREHGLLDSDDESESDGEGSGGEGSDSDDGGGDVDCHEVDMASADAFFVVATALQAVRDLHCDTLDGKSFVDVTAVSEHVALGARQAAPLGPAAALIADEGLATVAENRLQRAGEGDVVAVHRTTASKGRWGRSDVAFSWVDAPGAREDLLTPHTRFRVSRMPLRGVLVVCAAKRRSLAFVGEQLVDQRSWKKLMDDRLTRGRRMRVQVWRKEAETPQQLHDALEEAVIEQRLLDRKEELAREEAAAVAAMRGGTDEEIKEAEQKALRRARALRDRMTPQEREVDRHERIKALQPESDELWLEKMKAWVWEDRGP